MTSCMRVRPPRSWLTSRIVRTHGREAYSFPENTDGIERGVHARTSVCTALEGLKHEKQPTRWPSCACLKTARVARVNSLHQGIPKGSVQCSAGCTQIQ